MDRAKAFAVLAALAAVACSDSRRLVVGSKNFTEQLVLGEILAQQIERKLGVPVDRRLNLGGTLLAHQALVDGGIDLYPEYTGTALTAILHLPPDYDATRVFERVAKDYRERFRIEWLPPFGFNNSFAMVVKGADARAYAVRTISDAAKRPDGWALGIGYEFERRPDGLAALNRTYDLQWKAPPKTMDLGLLYRALEQNQVTMAAANTTDGLLSKLDFVALEDDKGAFPPYHAAVAVREQAFQKNPGLREALAALSGVIPAGLMRELNFKVDGEHRHVEDVAREFLDQLGK